MLFYIAQNTYIAFRSSQLTEVDETNNELWKQKEGCEKLQATLCNKDMEINELTLKIASLETRETSVEQENDSLKLALKIIMQEKSEGECQLQDNQIHEVTVPQRNSKSAMPNKSKSKGKRKLASEISSSNVEPEFYLEATKTTFSLKDPLVSVVRKLLAKLHVNERKAAGLDNIPPRLLKMAGNIIAPVVFSYYCC